jgi:CBS domain-containing protein
MKASDIMTSPVITVGPETSVREIAGVLFDNRISGVPVVDDGKLVGIVSEADLMHRHELGTDRVSPGSWWLRLFSANRSVPDYIKSHARRACDIMSREIVSVTPATPLAQIANLLETCGIKRVPVLRGGKLVGIVSRGNLIQALAIKTRSRKPATRQTDDAVRGRLLGELQHQPWWRAAASNVIVTDGIVHFWGMVNTPDERDAARVAAENIPGVRAVEDHRFNYQDLPVML